MKIFDCENEVKILVGYFFFLQTEESLGFCFIFAENF
jgi:hypothetical protein